MQTLFIPDIIQIDITDKQDNRIRQENILLGIKTFATHKNDIDLSPFLTDNEGHITITNEQIRNRADIFISYGIMDYIGIDYAKPNIKIYYWGYDSLDRYINYWTMLLKNKKDKWQYEKWGDIMGKFAKQAAELEIREREDLNLFETCFNRKAKQKHDIILTEDLWDKPATEKKYQVALSL